MPTLKKIIKAKLDRLETVPTRFEMGVQSAQRKVFDDILSSLDQLTRTNGKIDITTANLKLVEEIGAKAKESITGKEYVDTVKEFSKEFEKQAIITNDYFLKAFGTFTESEIANQILLNSRNIAVESMVAYVDNGFILPLKEVLSNSVASGKSWSDTVKEIRDFANDDTKLTRYSKQIAHDSFAMSDRAYTNEISKESGYEWFWYLGGLMGTSRKFCEDRNDRYYHKEEVKAWGNIKAWDGRAKGTNEKTIFIYAGGHNCQHSILPVSVFAVPIEDVRRNYENGNFKPDDFTKKELNL